MSAGQPTHTEKSTDLTERPLAKKVQFWLSVAVKLTVPLGTIGAAILAHNYQESEFRRSLTNQREQAETSLRATMFGQLVGPVFGQGKTGEDTMDPIRYSMLVQLTALNFAEHFELRPLMQHADQLLAQSQGRYPADVIQHARWELRFVAHRIINRQVAAILEPKLPPCKLPELGKGKTRNAAKLPAELTVWILSETNPRADADSHAENDNAADQRFYKLKSKSPRLLDVYSPDCSDHLSMWFDDADWTAETLHVQGIRSQLQTDSGQSNPEHRADAFDFTLTSFSFPFTDNTLLADGNRFSLFLKDVTNGSAGPQDSVMQVGIKWFPKDYHPPTERPKDQM